MRILLTDLNPQVVKHWREVDMPEGVEVHHRDIFAEPVDALVSPANSFGFMDGGIDAVYSRRWPDLQSVVQSTIRGLYNDELLVGDACHAATADPAFPLVIVAPTMRVPSPIMDPVSVRLSTRAAVALALWLHREGKLRQGLGECIAMPGMGALSGQVHPRMVALQMRAGILDAINGPRQFSTWQEAAHDHFAPLRAYAEWTGA